jgi:LPS export ABC transporter protein LptC
VERAAGAAWNARDTRGARLRRGALWAIPVVLLAALAWSFLPRGDTDQIAPPALPPAAPAASSADAAPGAASPDAARGGTAAPSQAAPPASPSQSETPAPSAAAPTSAPSGAATRPARTPGGAGVASGEIRLGDLVGTDDQGRVRWRVLADDMTLQEARQTVVLRRVRATFFDNDGSRMLVNGDGGSYNTRTRSITVEGHVHGVTGTGRELFADTVYYSPQTRQVEGQGNVRVVQERVIMYADRMISDLTLGQTRFFGHVHMTVR